MVPVRKPGRPLSTCPHPMSQTCACAAVTAAIPRKQMCACESAKPENMPAKREAPTPEAISTPLGPPSVNTFRVHKPRRSEQGRKSVVDKVGLERMGPNQLNIRDATNNSHFNKQTTHELAAAEQPKAKTNGDIPYPKIGQYNHNQHSPTSPFAHHQSPSPATSSMSQVIETQEEGYVTPETTMGGPIPGECCKQGSSSSLPATISSRSTTPISIVQNATKQPSSCCSSNAEGPTPIDSHPSQVVLTNDTSNISQVPLPVIVPATPYPYFVQPTIFTYPPQYGSYLQPLQPEQWRQVMAAVSYAPPNLISNYGIPNGVPYSYQSTSQSINGNSHECCCGESCDCVGCAAHPYNQATQDYVRSAWHSMTEDSRPKAEPNQQSQAQKQRGMRDPGSNYDLSTDGSPAGLDQTGLATEDTYTNRVDSPQISNPPSDTTSGLSEDQQQLSDNDFFFVSYPFNDEGCAGEMASCPCGDDCECIGCVIHDNSAPEDTNIESLIN